MWDEVASEDLQPGDMLEISTMYGPKLLKLTEVRHRVHGVKIVGIGPGGAIYSAGLAYGASARRMPPETA